MKVQVMSFQLAVGAALTAYGAYQAKQNYDALVVDIKAEESAVSLVKVDPTGMIVKSPAVASQLAALGMRTKQDRLALMFDGLLVVGGLYLVTKGLE